MIRSPYTRNPPELPENADAIPAGLVGRPTKSGVPSLGQRDALEAELEGRTTGSPASAAEGHFREFFSKPRSFDRVFGGLEAICEFEKGLSLLLISLNRIA